MVDAVFSQTASQLKESEVTVVRGVSGCGAAADFSCTDINATERGIYMIISKQLPLMSFFPNNYT